MGHTVDRVAHHPPEQSVLSMELISPGYSHQYEQSVCVEYGTIPTECDEELRHI
jgi:hypothetical protein